MRGILLIGFALFIDALQAGFGFAFAALQAVTPVGGGIGAAGACYALGAGVIDSLKCLVVGAGASAFAVPIGAAVDVTISVTLGGALIAALIFTGYFSLGAVTGGSIFEFMPLVDIAPGWTLMAWRCVHNKNVQDRAKQSAQPAQQTPDEPTPRAFDGIRAANDNIPYEQVAA